MIMYLVGAEDVHDEVDVYGRPGREEDHADPHQQQVGPPPPRLLPQERLGVGGGQRQPGHRRGDPGGAGEGIFPCWGEYPCFSWKRWSTKLSQSGPSPGSSFIFKNLLKHYSKQTRKKK